MIYATCSSRRRLTVFVGLIAVVASPDRATAALTFAETGATSFHGGLTALPAGHGGTSHLGSFNIVINASGALATNQPALDAFNRAAAQWEARISDPITVQIDAALASLGPNILGGAISSRVFAPYATSVGVAMFLDSTNEADDALVSNNLPIAPAFNLPNGFSMQSVPTGLTPPNGPSTTFNMQMTKANAKALGYTTVGGDDINATTDGIIEFNSAFAFDFDNSDGVDPNHIDFETVAAHEIGHILGFISEVERIDGLIDDALTANDVQPTTLDLFRFENGSADDPENATDFIFSSRTLVPGAAAIFDQIFGVGDSDAEVLMSTGSTQGDGEQASHWRDNLSLGIMDPTLASQEIVPVGANDFRALDLIGYEIIAVPEARGMLMVGLAGCIAGGIERRRRRSMRSDNVRCGPS